MAAAVVHTAHIGLSDHQTTISNRRVRSDRNLQRRWKCSHLTQTAAVGGKRLATMQLQSDPVFVPAWAYQVPPLQHALWQCRRGGFAGTRPSARLSSDSALDLGECWSEPAASDIR